MISDELKVAWAAGFFDGEGTVTIQRRKKKNGEPGGAYVMQMAVFQKHPEALFALYAICQCGSVHIHKKSCSRSSLWLWRASGNDARVVLARFAPHLVAKRDQSEIAIAFQQRRLTNRVDRANPMLRNAQRHSDEVDRVMIKAMKHVPFTHSYTQQ